MAPRRGRQSFDWNYWKPIISSAIVVVILIAFAVAATWIWGAP